MSNKITIRHILVPVGPGCIWMPNILWLLSFSGPFLIFGLKNEIIISSFNAAAEKLGYDAENSPGAGGISLRAYPGEARGVCDAISAFPKNGPLGSAPFNFSQGKRTTHVDISMSIDYDACNEEKERISSYVEKFTAAFIKELRAEKLRRFTALFQRS